MVAIKMPSSSPSTEWLDVLNEDHLVARFMVGKFKDGGRKNRENKGSKNLRMRMDVKQGRRYRCLKALLLIAFRYLLIFYPSIVRKGSPMPYFHVITYLE